MSRNDFLLKWFGEYPVWKKLEYWVSQQDSTTLLRRSRFTDHDVFGWRVFKFKTCASQNQCQRKGCRAQLSQGTKWQQLFKIPKRGIASWKKLLYRLMPFQDRQSIRVGLTPFPAREAWIAATRPPICFSAAWPEWGSDAWPKPAILVKGAPCVLLCRRT